MHIKMNVDVKGVRDGDVNLSLLEEGMVYDDLGPNLSAVVIFNDWGRDITKKVEAKEAAEKEAAEKEVAEKGPNENKMAKSKRNK